MNFSFDAVSPEQAHHRLVHRLCVDGVGCVGGRRAVRQADVARELAARNRGLEVLGRPEGRRARLHVDVRRKCPVDDGRTRPHRLRQRNACERLGVLQGERAGERDRCHRTGKREGRDDRELPRSCEVDQPGAHRDVELSRRVAVDHRVAAGRRREGLLVDAVSDAEQLEPVGDLPTAARIEVRHLVGERQVRHTRFEMTELQGHVLRFDARSRHVDHVEVLRQLDEVAEVGEVPVALPSVEITHRGRAADRNCRE